MSHADHVECPCPDCEGLRIQQMARAAWRRGQRERDEKANRLFYGAMQGAVLATGALFVGAALWETLLFDISPEWEGALIGCTILPSSIYGGWTASKEEVTRKAS